MKPNVLYCDENAIWSSLRHMFTSSNHPGICLSRHPLSVIEEVMSHYCPQCCVRYSEEENLTYEGKCSSCYTCPRCFSPVSIIHDKTSDNIIDDSKSSKGYVYLFCHMCTWKSKKYVISRESTTLNKLELYQCIRQDDITIRAQNNLDVIIQKLGERYLPPNISTSSTNTNTALVSLSHDSITSITNQPIRVSLRCKKMIRCRKDFDSGRMSILVQPKAAPLEGDSSLRIQRGKWWIKDSAAVHELPNVTIKDYPDISCDISGGKILLRGLLQFYLVNPKDTPISVKFTFIAPFGLKTMKLLIVDNNEKEPQTLRNCINISVSSRESIFVTDTINLAAFEDELLRDEEDVSVSSLSLDSQHVNKHDDTLSIFQYSVVHNVANCSLSLQEEYTIDDITDLKETSQACLDMLMNISSIDGQICDYKPLQIKVILPVHITY